MKIYFVEQTDMYSATSIVDWEAYTTEAQAGAVEKSMRENPLYERGYSFMVQEITVKYSHRNGERLWPEIEGAFWVEHFDRKFHAEEFFISELTGKLTCFDFQYLPSNAKVYGPIPLPTEEN